MQDFLEEVDITKNYQKFWEFFKKFRDLIINSFTDIIETFFIDEGSLLNFEAKVSALFLSNVLQSGKFL